MNSNDKPAISKSWWKSEKPADIRGSDLLESLGDAEKALAEQEKESSSETINECLEALGELNDAVEKTVKKECDKAKHKSIIAVLEKFDKVIAAEIDRLQKEKLLLEDDDSDDDDDEDEDEEEDEESDGKLFERDHLCKMIKKVRSGKELNFCFGINRSSPEDSSLIMNPRGKAEKLHKMMKRTGKYSDRLMTFGRAVADPENAKTLLFRLEESAGEPPQILKLAKKFLRADRDLKFKKIRIEMGGKSYEDGEDDDKRVS